jgi:hypothetical protein
VGGGGVRHGHRKKLCLLSTLGRLTDKATIYVRSITSNHVFDAGWGWQIKPLLYILSDQIPTTIWRYNGEPCSRLCGRSLPPHFDVNERRKDCYHPVAARIWPTGLPSWEREIVSFHLCDIPGPSFTQSFPGFPPLVPTKPRPQMSRAQNEKSSVTTFEPASFRLTVVRPTTPGQIIVADEHRSVTRFAATDMRVQGRTLS